MYPQVVKSADYHRNTRSPSHPMNRDTDLQVLDILDVQHRGQLATETGQKRTDLGCEYTTHYASLSNKDDLPVDTSNLRRLLKVCCIAQVVTKFYRPPVVLFPLLPVAWQKFPQRYVSFDNTNPPSYQCPSSNRKYETSSFPAL